MIAASLAITLVSDNAAAGCRILRPGNSSYSPRERSLRISCLALEFVPV